MMTGNARTRKDGGSKNMMKRMPKSGNRQNGENEKPCSCGKTLRVAVVQVIVRYPIIPTLKCTESPSTLIYPIHDPTATSVIQVSIPESSGVQVAEKLFQNKKVSDALHALRLAISSVLDPENPPVTKPRTKPTEKRTGAVIRAKKSTRVPGNGK
jgi:hypothetical protein